MKFKFQAIIAVLLAIICNVATKAQVVEKDLVMTSEERDKRALDLGDLVRNLLLKSATASNVKGNIARNVISAKAKIPPPTRRTTTTTTTTQAPPLFVKGPLKFPFDLSALSGPPINNKFNRLPAVNKFNNAGYINFDYNDYGGFGPVRPARIRRPTTTTTTTTTTTRAPPQPTRRRRPLPAIHYGQFGGRQRLNYYDDYNDYDYDDSTAPPPPPPPAARPRRPPTANRARLQNRLPQLRNRLVYQYAQADDTSTNDDNADANDDDDDVNSAAASNGNANEQSQQQQQSSNANEEQDDDSNNETSANTNDYNDDNENPANNPANPNNVEDYNDSSDNDNSNDNANANNNANANANENVSGNNNDNSDDGDNNSANLNTNFNPNNPNFFFNVDPPQFANFGGNNAPQAQFQFNGPGNANAFGASAGFQYPSFNDFTTQYQQQQPSSPAAYSVRYF